MMSVALREVNAHGDGGTNSWFALIGAAGGRVA